MRCSAYSRAGLAGIAEIERMALIGRCQTLFAALLHTANVLVDKVDSLENLAVDRSEVAELLGLFDTVIFDVLNSSAGSGWSIGSHFDVMCRHDGSTVEIAERALTSFRIIIGRSALEVSFIQAGLHTSQTIGSGRNSLTFLTLQLEAENTFKCPASCALALNISNADLLSENGEHRKL